MAETPSSGPKKVIDINGEVIQVGENNNTNTIFKNCIININYYNQVPPPTADTVAVRDHTTKPYLRQVKAKVKKKAKKNDPPAKDPGRPRDHGPASHIVAISAQRVVDNYGSVLEPGDVLLLGNNGNRGIFVGDGIVVRVDTKTSNVVKVPLDVTEPFIKWGLSSRFDRLQKLQRATGRVGQVFGGNGHEFAWWCCTGEKLCGL